MRSAVFLSSGVRPGIVIFLRSRSLLPCSSLFFPTPISLIRILSLVDVMFAVVVGLSESSVNQAVHSSSAWHVVDVLRLVFVKSDIECELTSCDEPRDRS